MVLQKILDNFSRQPVVWHTPGINEPETLPVYVSLKDLHRFDMRFAYHHLFCGRKLSLKIDYAIAGEEKVVVYYKNLLLGVLDGSGAETVREMLLHGFDLQVTVHSLKKRKYMPVEHMVVAVSENELSN